MRRRIAAVLLAATVLGCAGPVSTGTPDPTVQPATAPASASASTQGNYKLELVLPRLTWNAGDPLSGTAILSLTDSLPTNVAGAAQLIAFAFDEVGGNRHVTPGWDQSCVQYPLDQATPQSVALYKSGVFEGNEPDADFLRSFFADPAIHLPSGTWDITAIASFSEGGCAAPTHTIEATVRIHVTG